MLNLIFQTEWQADAEDRGISTKGAGLTLGVDNTNGLRVTYLIVSAVPPLVAILAFFLMPRKARQDYN